MSAAASSVTVNVEPDLSGIGAALKAAVAAELRKMADELDPQPPRALVGLVDGDGDRWTLQQDGSFQMDANHSLVRTRAEVARAYGIREELYT